jgi:hypothetical protein
MRYTATASNVRWLPDKTKNVVGCSWDINSIPAGISNEYTCVFPGYAQKGTFDYIFLIDPDNKVAESNEGNNSCYGPVTIGP